MAIIYLIGYMGSGKSTAGSKLASKLNYEFIDMDNYIENEQQKTIPQLFEEQGEAGFRTIEHEALKQLSQKSDVVISSGGGTPCFHNNMDIMNKTGITLYIKLDLNTLIDRLTKAKEQRPLLKNKTTEELKTFISEQLYKRENFYSKAQHIVQGINLNVNELVELLQKKIN